MLRYFRSGNEIYRQAKTYLQEGDFESAYILFMRFLTLFVEKIREHPKLKEVPAETRKQNKAKIQEIMPMTEMLKKKLQARYTKEYEQYLVEKEKEHNREKNRAIEEAKRKVS